MKDILLVDDERPFLLSLAEGLGFYSKYFNIITAENGKKAIEILRTVVVDVVVTDLKMPVADGFELLEYMKKNHPRIPVIVITAFGDQGVEERLRSFDISEYLEKPLDFKVIAEKILASAS